MIPLCTVHKPSSCGLSSRQALSVSMSISLKVTLADENRNLLSLRMRNKISIADGAT